MLTSCRLDKHSRLTLFGNRWVTANRSFRSRRRRTSPHGAREVLTRITREGSAGPPLRAIAEGLNADHVPTAHDGRSWYASSVAKVLAGQDARRLGASVWPSNRRRPPPPLTNRAASTPTGLTHGPFSLG
jgi:hypothetical protein